MVIHQRLTEITENLFQEWKGKSPLFASSLTLDLSSLKQAYDICPFVMQLNESDYDFLTRLWRSEGINWLIKAWLYDVQLVVRYILDIGFFLR